MMRRNLPGTAESVDCLSFTTPTPELGRNGTIFHWPYSFGRFQWQPKWMKKCLPCQQWRWNGGGMMVGWIGEQVTEWIDEAVTFSTDSPSFLGQPVGEDRKSEVRISHTHRVIPSPAPRLTDSPILTLHNVVRTEAMPLFVLLMIHLASGPDRPTLFTSHFKTATEGMTHELRMGNDLPLSIFFFLMTRIVTHQIQQNVIRIPHKNLLSMSQKLSFLASFSPAHPFSVPHGGKEGITPVTHQMCGSTDKFLEPVDQFPLYRHDSPPEMGGLNRFYVRFLFLSPSVPSLHPL